MIFGLSVQEFEQLLILTTIVVGLLGLLWLWRDR